MSDPNYNLTSLMEAVEARLEPSYELTWIDYRDRLSDDQVAMLVRGDWDALFESTEDWEADQRYESARTILNDLADEIVDGWEREASEVTEEEDWDNVQDTIREVRDSWDASDAFEDLRFVIYERDSSEPIRDLAHNTPAVLLRIPLADDPELVDDTSPEDLLTSIGLPVTPENIGNAGDIIANAGDWGLPFVLVAVDPVIFYDIPRDTEGVTLTIKDPHLLLSNPYAGDGWEEGLKGEITVPLADVHTDEDAPGYSWQNIAGVYVSAYEGEVVVNVPAEAVAA
jgi:hypothetical protein